MSGPEIPKDPAALAKMAAFGEMSREIMHEINTPLTTMGLHVQKIKKAISHDPIDTQTIAASTDSLSTNLLRINNLRETIRERYSAATTKQLHKTNLQSSLKDALNLCKDVLSEKRITVHLNTPPDIFFDCKSVDLSEVWVNLIQNAAEAIAAKAERWIRIEVKTSLDEKLVMVSVTDSGTDMSDAIKKRIFQETFTTKPNGSGLGLNIAKGIVESCGGTIELAMHSQYTQFQVFMPRA